MYNLQTARSNAALIFLNSESLNKNAEYDRKAALTDTDVLISHILKKSRAWILTHTDFDFTPYKKEFEQCVKLRASGLACAYITGEKEFFALPFYVNRNVLIPKPDTELLVEKALQYAKKELYTKNEFFYADICTGSGCIAVSVLNELKNMLAGKQTSIVLSDICGKALNTARLNAERLLPESVFQNMRFEKADLRCGLPFAEKKYTLITANPPYVPSHITEELLKDGRGEPALALDGGEKGLSLIEPFAENAAEVLAKGGKVLCEIGEYHAASAREAFLNANFSAVTVHNDLSGAARLIEADF